eukprot:4331516-Amphidinium_carterae.1
MDDHDNQIPSDQVFPNVPFRETLDLEGRMLEASVAYGLQEDQINSALRFALGREREVDAQANERFVHHAPAEMVRRQRVREILLNVAHTAADLQAAESLGIQTTTMHVNIDPSQFPPAFSGPPHRLETENRDNSEPPASTAQGSDVMESAMPKAMPKPKAAPA